MFDLNPINQFVTKREITQPAPSPLPFTNLRGGQSVMSNLHTSHIQFSNMPREKIH